MAHSKSSSSKNYIYNVSYKVLAMLTPLITAPYLARIIGSEGVGVYSYTYSIAYNFMLLAKLGLMNYGSRAIARVRDDDEKLSKTFSQIYILQLITTLFATILYFGFVNIYMENYRLISLVNSAYVIGIALDIDWLFYGLEKFKVFSIRNAIVKVATVLAILAFVKRQEDLVVYVSIMAISDIVKYLSIWISFSSCTKISAVRIKEIFSHFKSILILFIPVIATSVYRSMDKIMLGSLSTMSETGIYENSEKIIYMLLGFVTSLEMVMMPKITNLLEKGDNKAVLDNIAKSFSFVVFLTSGMAFGIAGISETFVPWFYGVEFLGCIKLLPLLGITLIFIGWANIIRTQYIMPKGRDHIYVISTIVGAVINLIVNIIYIPKLGAIGAVIGTIAAELSVATYLSIVVRKELPIRKYLVNNLVYPVVGLLMAVIVYLLGKVSSGSYFIIIQIVIGGAVYIILSGLYLKKSQPELFSTIELKLKSIFKKTAKRG